MTEMQNGQDIDSDVLKPSDQGGHPVPPNTIEETECGSVASSVSEKEHEESGRNTKSKKTVVIAIVAGILLLIAVIVASAFVTSCNETNRRERIIVDYLENQHDVYGWERDELSYKDYGDVVIVRFKSSDPDILKHGPIGVSFDEAGAQIEADQLASSLDCDVVIVNYEGDWLYCINLGLPTTSSSGFQEKTKSLVRAALDEGIEHAKKCRKQALDGFVDWYSDNDCSVKYEITDDEVTYIVFQAKSGIEWIKGDNDDEWRKSIAESAAHYLWMPVSVGFINGDGSLYGHFDSYPKSYLYDKSTGDFVKK